MIDKVSSPERRRGATAWRAVLVGSAAAAALLGPGMACAADAAPDKATAFVDEIVVTARKRAEGIYSTPMAISAFTSESLAARNVSDLADLGKFVPNVNITRFGAGNSSHASVFIRGIGIQDHIITTDPGVGVYVDGVYLGREMGANLDLVNVERVEVLRGPQGTLFGRNTLGGAVNIITRQPGDEDSGLIQTKIGTRERVDGDFYENFKMADTLAVSLAGGFKHRDGVGDFVKVANPEARVGQQDEISGRIAAKWTPSDTFSALLAVDGLSGKYGLSPATDEIINPNGYFTAGSSGLKQSDIATGDDSNSGQVGLETTTNKAWGTALTTDWKLDEHLSLKVIGSYRSSTYTGGLDDDMALADFASFPEKGGAKQYSLETQLNGEYGKADFVGGLYYFHEKGSVTQDDYMFFALGDFNINQTTESYAAYAHAGYQLTPALKLAGGLRYSHDAKDADAIVTCCAWTTRVYRSDDWGATTWDASVEYDLKSSLKAFASVSTGYQSGGYPARPYGGPDLFVSYNPTHATNFEAGLKGLWTDYLQMSASVFYAEYKDLALQYSQPTTDGFITITSNAGKAKAPGAEMEGVLKLGESLKLYGSAGYLDAKIKQVKAGTIGVRVGDAPSLSPKWTLAFAPEYEMELASGSTVTFRVDYSYRSSMYGQSINNAYNKIAARELVNLNVLYKPEGKSWTAALYGQNIFNKVYDVGRLDQYDVGYVEIIRSNDRSEFGIKLTKTFD
jgi:iron complex outermembrane receptor protein